MVLVNNSILKVIIIALFAWHSGTALADAVLISFSGEAKVKAANSEVWRAAKVNEVLNEGFTLKTEKYSNANLLFEDGTQIKLAENSSLLIRVLRNKSSSKVSSTDLLLSRGKIWGRSKETPENLSISSVTATATIRGTEWEFSLSNDQKTHVTVVSGEVNLSNSFGSVSLFKDYEGSSDGLSSPVYSQVNEARDRVQWVSRYTPYTQLYRAGEIGNAADKNPHCVQGASITRPNKTPVRTPESTEDLFDRLRIYMREGNYADASAIIAEEAWIESTLIGKQVLTDLFALSGNYARARETLKLAIASFSDCSAIDTQNAAIALHFGDLTEVKRYIANLSKRTKVLTEDFLVQGDFYALEGKFQLAKKSYEAALNNDKQSIKSLLKLSMLHTEYGEPLKGESYMNSALAINAEDINLLRLLAENAISHSKYFSAIEILEGLAEKSPNDVVIRNSLALAYLATSDVEEAMKSSRAAGVIAPSSSMPNLTTGVIFYEQNNTELALKEFEEAAEKDEKNPLPFLLASAVLSDTGREVQAVEYSYEALDRLPYLKSLNKIKTDKRGSSNLGYAYSGLSLEGFATFYALASYEPSWAGSDFFLSERLTDEKARGSIALRGFLNDPNALGASKSKVSLLDKANHSAEVFYDYLGDDLFVEQSANVVLSGQIFYPVPSSYFASYSKGSLIDEYTDDGDLLAQLYQFSSTPLPTCPTQECGGQDLLGQPQRELQLGEFTDLDFGSAWNAANKYGNYERVSFGVGSKLTPRLNVFGFYLASEGEAPIMSHALDIDAVSAGSANLYTSSGNLTNDDYAILLNSYPLALNATAYDQQKLLAMGTRFLVTDNISIFGKYSEIESENIYTQTTLDMACSVSDRNEFLRFYADDVVFNNELRKAELIDSVIGATDLTPEEYEAIGRSLAAMDRLGEEGLSMMETASISGNHLLNPDFLDACGINSLAMASSTGTQTSFLAQSSSQTREWSIAVDADFDRLTARFGYERSEMEREMRTSEEYDTFNPFYQPLKEIQTALGSVSPLAKTCQTYNGLPDTPPSAEIGPEDGEFGVLFANGPRPWFCALSDGSGPKWYDSDLFHTTLSQKMLAGDYVLDSWANVSAEKSTNEYAWLSVSARFPQDLRFTTMISGYKLDASFSDDWFSPFWAFVVKNLEATQILYDVPEEDVFRPGGLGWNVNYSAEIQWRPRNELALSYSFVNSITPAVNLSLRPFFLGRADLYSDSTPGNTVNQSNRLNVTYLASPKLLFELDLETTKFRHQRNVNYYNFNPMGREQDSEQQETQYATGELLDQMRSSELRGVSFYQATPGSSYCGILTADLCLKSRRASLRMDAILSNALTLSALAEFNDKSTYRNGFYNGFNPDRQMDLIEGFDLKPYREQGVPRQFFQAVVNTNIGGRLRLALAAYYFSDHKAPARIADFDDSADIPAGKGGLVFARWRSESKKIKVGAQALGLFSDDPTVYKFRLSVVL